MVVGMTETVQIHEAELARLLNENQRLRAQVTEVQAYAGRLLETRTRPAEAALASLRAAAQRVVALRINSLDVPDPGDWDAISDLVEAAGEVAKAPAPAAPVVTLSAEQARLTLEAFEVWVTNMQCVEETPAMLAVSDHIRAALDGAPRG